MNLNSTFLTLGNFEIKFNHILVFSILCLSFSISFLIRILPGFYGWELNEFDPFFNFRATEYIVENGINSYFTWHDDLSWYPHGRDVSYDSQNALHIITAILYWLFGANTSLYDFTIIIPVIFGSVTTFFVFLLVRIIAGTSAGMLSSLLFSVSLPIIFRGTLGWFKSEPLGLCLGILSVYLFLSGIKNEKSNLSFLRFITGGILLSIAISAWGGIQFFVIPIAIFIFVFSLYENKNSILWRIPFFVISFLLTALIFERPGLNLITGHVGLLIISSVIFSTLIFSLKKYPVKNLTLLSLIIFLSISILFLTLDIFVFDSQYSFRYYNSLNPLLTTLDPLVDSVSEHSSTSIQQSYFFHTVLLIFSGIGIWIIFSKNYFFKPKNSLFLFTLIFGILGVYASSSYLRLEIFTSLSLIILTSIGFIGIIKSSNEKFLNKKRKIVFNSILGSGLIILLMTPLILSSTNPALTISSVPPTILNGGSQFPIASNDWLETLNWIKNNTEKNSVVLAWWDYGYWIQTLAQRPTISDGSTLNSEFIKKTAKIFSNKPDHAWKLANEMEADYILIFVSATRLPTQLDDQRLYLFEGGGDETKRTWFYFIAEENPSEFVFSDGISGTDYFWNETLLGKLIPYSVLGYVDPTTNQDYYTYVPNTIGVYKKEIKFSENDPFNLVYASPSFYNEQSGPVMGVFVYEINKNYIPKINLD